MGLLRWLNRKQESHAPPDIERDSAETIGRLDALCEQLEGLVSSMSEWDGEEDGDG